VPQGAIRTSSTLFHQLGVFIQNMPEILMTYGRNYSTLCNPLHIPRGLVFNEWFIVVSVVGFVLSSASHCRDTQTIHKTVVDPTAVYDLLS